MVALAGIVRGSFRALWLGLWPVEIGRGVCVCVCVCVCACAHVRMRKREKENSEVPQQHISNFNVHSWEPPKIL